MATPTPGSASKRLGGGVSTPSHINQSSPAPRSVPSPNATRHPAGKTPINHPTTSSSQGSKTVGSTPMVQSLSHQSGSFASPSANHATGTPGFNPLGIHGLTPGPGLDSLTPSFGGLLPRGGSAIPTTELTKRNEDEERKAKMRKVLKRIGKPTGHVSEEGITRLARRVGLVSDIDDEHLTVEQKERKVGNRGFSVAGESILVTVTLKDQIPQSVEVGGDVSEPERAAEILLADLKPRDVALTATLDRFAANLNHLAQIDHLKKNTGTDCFAALNGVYRSLRKLYDLEEETSIQNMSGEKASMQVMCKKSGKPSMHTRSRLGLHLDYWQHLVAARSQPSQDEDRMEVDDSNEHSSSRDHVTPVEPGIFTMRIGADNHNLNQGMPTMTPLRISNEWLPDSLQLLPTDSMGQDLPWQEPPANITAMTTDMNGAIPTGQHPQQSLRFVAALDPPIVIPLQAAMNSGLPVPPMSSQTTYTDLLLRPSSDALSQVSVPRPDTYARRDVLSLKSGEEHIQHHGYTLATSNAQLTSADVYRTLPFASPKDLVRLLPLLRQWAAAGTLLEQAFQGGMADDSTTNRQNATEATSDSSLSDILNDAPMTYADDTLAVNIMLSTEPAPVFDITFPLAVQDGPTANISVQILENADTTVEIRGGFEITDAEHKSKLENRLAKALLVCWDLGVWIEWVRVHYG